AWRQGVPDRRGTREARAADDEPERRAELEHPRTLDDRAGDLSRDARRVADAPRGPWRGRGRDRDGTSPDARPRVRRIWTACRQRFRASPEEVRRLPRQAVEGSSRSARGPRREGPCGGGACEVSGGRT